MYEHSGESIYVMKRLFNSEARYINYLNKKEIDYNQKIRSYVRILCQNNLNKYLDLEIENIAIIKDILRTFLDKYEYFFMIERFPVLKAFNSVEDIKFIRNIRNFDFFQNIDRLISLSNEETKVRTKNLKSAILKFSKLFDLNNLYERNNFNLPDVINTTLIKYLESSKINFEWYFKEYEFIHLLSIANLYKEKQNLILYDIFPRIDGTLIESVNIFKQIMFDRYKNIISEFSCLQNIRSGYNNLIKSVHKNTQDIILGDVLLKTMIIKKDMLWAFKRMK